MLTEDRITELFGSRDVQFDSVSMFIDETAPRGYNGEMLGVGLGFSKGTYVFEGRVLRFGFWCR